MLPSDPFFFEPTEPTESQITELTPLPLPPSIQRTGGRTQQWALWTEETKTEFLEWWLTTQYGTIPDAKHIHWDKRRYSSKVWTSFDQVAHIPTGKPKVLCQKCYMMLSHPYPKNGTSAMGRHQTNGSCQKSKGKQTNIQQSFKNMVCLLEREK
jgi:hypothetical protein